MVLNGPFDYSKLSTKSRLARIFRLTRLRANLLAKRQVCTITSTDGTTLQLGDSYRQIPSRASSTTRKSSISTSMSSTTQQRATMPSTANSPQSTQYLSTGTQTTVWLQSSNAQ